MYQYRATRCRIKEILKEKRMSQMELALKINFSKQQISDIVNGRYVLGLNNAMTIAKALNVNIEDLYEWEKEEI
ncbi:helix-turn-helix transcriptional regulator [Geobacillus thermodenitrificans]|jgi:DNA-binding XRE family transcriptional regulator|uniref:helix-turn-helix transcriptional regulator n=1 Tax=Geobacillus thermodenitrificans TaxID=33940 RepID=UPI003D2149DF